MVQVVRVAVTRREMGEAARKELFRLFHLERLPLMMAKVEIEIKGVPTAVVNALRRVAVDEMPGHALQLPPDGLDTGETTEEFMLHEFVGKRISLLPLRYRIPAEVVEGLRLGLDVSNKGTAPLYVYAGDLTISGAELTEHLFNPTTKLAFVSPGKRLVLRDIRIATGYGRDNGVFQVARRGAYTHLDIPQYTDAEMREEGGPAVDHSGYKASSMVADPRHHLLTAYIPATPADATEARAVFVDACTIVKDRLRLIKTATETPKSTEAASGKLARGIQYTVVKLSAQAAGLNEGILQVPNETHTIGELLRRTVYELEPEISYVAYVANENRLVLTIRHVGDVTELLSRAIDHAMGVFDDLMRGISTARAK